MDPAKKTRRGRTYCHSTGILYVFILMLMISCGRDEPTLSVGSGMCQLRLLSVGNCNEHILSPHFTCLIFGSFRARGH